MTLQEKIGNMDFQKISARLEQEAFASLRSIITNNSFDVDIKRINLDEVDLRKKLSIIIDGYPGFPVFEFNFDLFKGVVKIGSYRYLADLDLNYLDEFFVTA